MKNRAGMLVAMAVGLAVVGQGVVSVQAQEAISTMPAMAQQDLKIVASDTTKTYHQAACRFANKIKPAHRVEFASVDEAQKVGYTPCKVCMRTKGAQHASAGTTTQ